MLHDVIDMVGQLGSAGIVAMAFVLAFAESAVFLDLVVPGEVGLVLAGAAAAEAGAPLWLLVAASAIGAVAGDSIGYWIGRRVGVSHLTARRWWRRHLAKRVDRAQRWFERRGGLAVAGARWVGALRAVVPVVAGTARMPYRRLVAWDAPSSAVWSAVVLTVGYTVGRRAADFVDRAGSVVSLVFVGFVVLVVWWRRRRGARPPVWSRHRAPSSWSNT